MSDHKPVLSIVVPCYNEAETLPLTLPVLEKAIDDLVACGIVHPASGLCLIDDGSQDATWSLIEARSRLRPTTTGLRLTTNFGQQAALLAGLHAAKGDLVLTIDADLQDDIGILPQMIEAARNGAEIVFGVRRTRGGDGALKRLGAHVFYSAMKRLGARSIPQHSDFRLMSRAAVEALRAYGETNLYLRGLIASMGFPIAILPYDQNQRPSGDTKYTLRKMISLSLGGITSFSMMPLRIIAMLGFLVSLAATLCVFWVLWVALFTDRAVPGWASTLVPLLLLSGVQLIALGVIGEYVGRTYMEAKRRPPYLIHQRTGAPGADTPH